MADITKSKTSHFFRLPRELRDLVYAELPTISAPTKITHKWYKSEELKASVSGLPSTSLLLVNKQFRHEYEMIANSSLTLVMEDHVSDTIGFFIDFRKSAALAKVKGGHLKLRLATCDNNDDVDCHMLWIGDLIQAFPYLRDVMLNVRVYDAYDNDTAKVTKVIDEYHDQLEKLQSLPFVSTIGVRTLTGWANPTSCDYDGHSEHIANWCATTGIWRKSKEFSVATDLDTNSAEHPDNENEK